MAEKTKLLEIRDLKKHFSVKKSGFNKKQTVKAVDGVTLDIYKGETLGLVGESGCGKTTLGRTIIRLHEPTSGSIVYDGKTIYDSEKKIAEKMLPYRRKMQIILQDPSASQDQRMTVGEIVGEALDIHKLCAGKAERTERIDQLLDAVGLNTEHANRFPHEFSGGQQQRLCIARALIKKPKIVILDDSTSAVDTDTDKRIRIALKEKLAGMTTIIIAQRVASVIDADQILMMEDGKIVSRGTHEELLKISEAYRDLYESQTQGVQS